jgi:tetratricopeptide (TPR) repeat protein
VVQQGAALESGTSRRRAGYAKPSRRIQLVRPASIWGLLHEAGRHAEAERVYREAIKVSSTDAVLHYNLGVLLEDMGRKNEALEAYVGALRRDPDLADCHYNLALLCEELKQPKDAIRHMARYRKLTEK